MCLSPKKEISLQQEEQTVTFSFGRVPSVNHKEKKSRNKDSALQGIELMKGQNQKYNNT